MAREFKFAPQAVRNWVKIGDLDSGRRSDGLTTSERDELAKLRISPMEFEKRMSEVAEP